MPKYRPVTAEEREKIDLLVSKLDDVDLSTDELDRAVDEMKETEAAMINENGVSSQVDYLLQCNLNPKRVLAMLRNASEPRFPIASD